MPQRNSSSPPSLPASSQTSRRRRALRTAGSFAFLGMLGLLATGFWLSARDGGGDALDQMAQSMSLKAEDVRGFTWVNHEKKHWQIVGDGEIEPVDATDAREGTRGACPAGMVQVVGEATLDSYGTDRSDEVESAQTKTCATWINKDFPARCEDFDPQAWAESRAKFKRKELAFCIDRFEYPNRKGAYPWIVVTYNEAAALCKADGKRLCDETEWTLACEGEEATPYPNGYQRGPDACVVDRTWREFNARAMQPRSGARAEAELDRLWQGEASGSRAACRSSFGVYDMTGNVDEWTRSVRRGGYASVLKGGYWGPVRARCRPATRAHDENYVGYQQSFRCCSDLDADSVRDARNIGPDAGLDAGAGEDTRTAPPHTGDAEAALPDGVEPEVGVGPESTAIAGDDGLDEDEELGKKARGRFLGCGR